MSKRLDALLEDPGSFSSSSGTAESVGSSFEVRTVLYYIRISKPMVQRCLLQLPSWNAWKVILILFSWGCCPDNTSLLMGGSSVNFLTITTAHFLKMVSQSSSQVYASFSANLQAQN